MQAGDEETESGRGEKTKARKSRKKILIFICFG